MGEEMNRFLSTTVDNLGVGVGCATEYIMSMRERGSSWRAKKIYSRRSSSNSSFVTGVIGLNKSPWLLDFSRRFIGDTSISKLTAFLTFSGECVTTVARRFLDGV